MIFLVVLFSGVIGSLVTYTLVLVFRDTPWVLLMCSIVAAIFSSTNQPPCWIMSTYFPNGERLRGMTSLGEGFCGLIAVTLHTVIRGIVYVLSSGDEVERQQNGDYISFLIFFGCFYALLVVAFGIAWFVPKLESFKYFEKKALALQNGPDEETAPLNTPTASENGEAVVVVPAKQPRGIFRFLSWTFLCDISLPCCLLFSTLFGTLMAWPTLAQVYYSGNSPWGGSNPQIQNEDYIPKMLQLDTQGWPFDDRRMIKWFWSPLVIGTFNLSDVIGRFIPSTR